MLTIILALISAQHNRDYELVYGITAILDIMIIGWFIYLST